MANSSKSNVGVEISFNVIKIVHYTIIGKIISKSYYTEIGINRVQFLDFIRSSVSDFVKENLLTSVNFNFSITYDENNGRIGFLSIPKLDRKNSDKAIKYELQDKNAEDNLEKFHTLTEKVNSGADSEKISYATAIVKKDLIEALSKLKKVSWNIESIEMRPITIGRLIEDTSIVIDYGRRNTFLYYYKNGILVDLSPIPSGWIRINEIIEEIHPSVTPREMEIVKNQIFLFDDSSTYSLSSTIWSETRQDIEIDMDDLSNLESGFDKDELMEISVRATQEIKYITEEIKRLIRVFELAQDVTINNLYFTGDTANFSDFMRLFSEELEIETLPLSKILVGKSKEIEEEADVVAAMATLYSSSKYFKSMNFSRFARNNYDVGSLLVAVIILAAIVHGGMIHIHNTYDARTQTVTQDLSKIDNELASLDNEIVALRMQEQSSSDISVWLNHIDSERIWLSEFFYHLPQITPNGVAFNKITVQNNLITLRGYAKNYSNVGFLAMELEALGNMTIQELTREQSESPVDGTVETEATAGASTAATSVIIENIMTDGSEESFSSNNSFTLKINAAFPLNTYNE